MLVLPSNCCCSSNVPRLSLPARLLAQCLLLHFSSRPPALLYKHSLSWLGGSTRPEPEIPWTCSQPYTAQRSLLRQTLSSYISTASLTTLRSTHTLAPLPNFKTSTTHLDIRLLGPSLHSFSNITLVIILGDFTNSHHLLIRWLVPVVVLLAEG